MVGGKTFEHTNPYLIAVNTLVSDGLSYDVLIRYSPLGDSETTRTQYLVQLSLHILQKHCRNLPYFEKRMKVWQTAEGVESNSGMLKKFPINIFRVDKITSQNLPPR